MENSSKITEYQLLFSISNNIDAMLAYWDKDQICRFANNAYIDWFGKSNEEMINRITLKELLGDIYAKNLPYIKEVLKGNIQKFERDFKTPSGETKHSLASYYPDIIDGKVQGFIVHVTDISERKKYELALSKSDERNKIFVKQSPNAIAMFDKELRYLAASQKWVDDYKLNGKEISGRSHYEIFPEIGDDWKKIHQECLSGAINKSDESSFERADGTTQWISWDVRPWYIKDDEIGGILMYTADITEQKKKEKERHRIEEILEKTNEVARIGSWEFDLIEKTITWSKITKQIHEVSDDYIPDLEKAINFIKEGESRERISEAVNNAIETGLGYDLELQIITAKNKTIWVRAIGMAEFKNQKCIKLYGVFHDINDVKTNKVAIDKLNDDLSTILNAGYVSIIGTDLNGTITHFNKGAEKLLQYTADELVEKHSPAIIHLENEVIERGIELSNQLNKEVKGFDVFIEIPKQEKFESREWTYVRKDGTHFPVQLVVTSVINKLGKKTGYIGIATDLSERKGKENEMKALLDITIDQNERLKNFAHIVSHNLRSHSTNFEMMLDLYVQDNPELINNEYISLLKTSSGNLKETISNLNEVVEMNTAFDDKLVPINLFQTVQTAISNVTQIAKDASVKIINNVEQNCHVLGLQAYLDSINLNFITNGIKYRNKNISNSELVISAFKVPDFIVLEFKDNGLGIDLRKNKAKLFGMYKTFHGNEDARGIGLFITKNQVEAMGGKIEVESELEKGTTFKIYLKNEKN